MKSQEIKNNDKNYIANTYKRFDLCIEKGKGSTCTSFDGKEYIDFTSGIGVNIFGFCDEGWIQAINSQSMKLQHISNLYYTEPCVNVAKILCEQTGLNKVFFANSGAEANECAIKTVRKYSNDKYGKEANRTEIITLLDSFHGRTMAALTATGQENYHNDFFPFVQNFSYAIANNINDLIEKISDKTCAIMVEIVQGEGGVNPLSIEYINSITKICKENDILFIVDEVQTGIARTGTLFSYQQMNITPDIVTFAKGIGGGLPLGGAIFGSKCENVLQFGNHGTTFGGNPIACAGATYILESLTPKFLNEVKEKGEYIKANLRAIAKIKSVVGMGMMIGIEVDGFEANDIVSKALEAGLILLTAKQKVRLLPPLNITYNEIDKGLAILRKVLES